MPWKNDTNTLLRFPQFEDRESSRERRISLKGWYTSHDVYSRCVYNYVHSICVNVWDADVRFKKRTMAKWSVPEQPACGVITRFPIHAVSVHVLRFYIEDNMQNETQTL